MQCIQPGLGSDSNKARRHFNFFPLGSLRDQVGKRVGEGCRFATRTARGNQREHNLVEEIGETFAAGVAGVVPGATVPETSFAVCHLVVPLIPFHANVVLLGNPVLVNGIVKELVVSKQRALVQD